MKPTSHPILTIEGLDMGFGEVRVLRGVNATFAEGEITALVGPNGAGKTTLFHAITGYLQPQRGKVLFGDQPLTHLAPWKVARLGIGKMFQDVRLFGELSVMENLLLALHEPARQTLSHSLFKGFRRSQRNLEERDRAAEFLRMTGVEEPWDRPAKLLSFGNQKLVALSRLMAGNFKLWLLDEPSAGVAPPLVERMSALLTDMVGRRGVSVALIEHNFSFVEEVASQAYLLRNGEIMDRGPVREVLEKPENREVLIGL